MSCSKLPLHVLQELPNITDTISSPLKSSQRIKYTCFDVSKTLIVFGATSGGIYVFNRNPCEFVQLIPNKDGAITRLAVSPDELHVGFANGRGTVTVTEQKLTGCHKPVSSREHQGNEVTALVWGGGAMLFASDDTGKVSVLQLPNFITKTMFQSASQTIMSLDSRVCQLDIKDNMLLVSTLTRCYICDTLKEQYRQIGQKLRDGEYGACFVATDRKIENGTVEQNNKDYTEVKQFNIVDGNEAFAVNEKLANVAIFSARPSSRLWEASIDGTVQRTHQFKQVLARQAVKVITTESYTNENVSIERFVSNETDGQSCNFPKIFSLNSSPVVSFKKDALYFLDVQDVDNTMWFDAYKDIVDCKMYHDFVYLWMQNGSLVCLRFMKIDKFLIKCFLDEKYVLCAELCALFSSYFVTSNTLSPKLNILAGLRNKRTDVTEIEEVVQKFESLKSNDATVTKSGIYVVDNTYHNRESLLSECDDDRSDQGNRYSTEPLQTLKDLMSTSVTDTLNSSKKMLKEKWEGFEVKMKHLSEKQQDKDASLPKKVVENIKQFDDVKPEKVDENHVDEVILPVIENQNNEVIVPLMVSENDIIFKESSQKAIEVKSEDVEQNKIVSEKDKICRALYQHFRLSLLEDKESEDTNLLSLLDSYSCDTNEIHELMLLFEEYCVKIGAVEESKYAPNNIYLRYLDLSPSKDNLIDKIISDDVLYKYFVDSCISVNIKTQKLTNLGCECGFPLPYVRTQQNPAFSELIDQFIERQWTSQTKEQCYDMCKRMPYLWRKILYLRRNEDLMNILRLLLQMLDESLLHSFLPQFTLETWDKAVQLYAVLHSNICLNCNRVFDHNISVKQTLSWDDIGALLIKSVGGKNAIKVMERNAEVIGAGEISMRFYHACLLVAIFDKYDGDIIGPLTDTIYSCYGSEEARIEICKLIKSTVNGTTRNSALPLIVAANSQHWGLSQILEGRRVKTKPEEQNLPPYITLVEVLDILDGNTDCVLCGLPLVNEVLIKDGGLWAFKCGHTFHGSCLELNKLRLCPSCSVKEV